jgi:septal ring factor EnvC (AmiA/AmiB activator)
MRTHLARVTPARHTRRSRARAREELAQFAAKQQQGRQEGKRVLQAIGGGEARSGITTERIAELDERANKLEQRMAELRDELAAVQRDTVSAASIQRAVTLFDPVWGMLLVPERFRERSGGLLHFYLRTRP